MKKRCYLFAYFYGNGTDGMHLAWSHDGLVWKPLKNDESFLVPAVGEKLMRDPFVMLGPDGMFKASWTTSWHERGIGVCSSPDLVNWGKQTFVPVMMHEPDAINAWAPEMVYDREEGEYIIFWSTTIPGRFPDTDWQNSEGGVAGKGLNNRIYCVTTKDFETFSKTRLFYDPGYNVIDACIRPDGQRYVMFIKDETNLPWVPQKNVKVATAAHAEGPYSKPSAPITGKFWAEGPTGLKIDDTWYVYFDRYRDHKYGVVTSKDLANWTDVTDKLVMPPHAKHGTAFEVPEEVLERLMAL